jgi:DNA polymerase-3 subunit beta
MKINIARQDLLDAVNKVKTVVSPKSALPILSHILLEAKDNTVRLSVTDLKVSIECTIDCTVDKPGSMTVSCQRLASILAELPDADISLSLGKNSVVELSCGKIQTKLFSMSPEEFPPIRNFDGVEPIVLSQSQLKGLFNKTSFAICTDQARYNLTGLLFELAGGSLTAVSTDGRRMSLASESGVPDGIELKVIIPGKMIHELERLLSGDDEMEVFIDEAQAAFVLGSTRLVTALIEGNFPNYDSVIPSKHEKEVIMDSAIFNEAMRRTRTMTNDKFNSVRVSIEAGLMTLRVVTPEVGEYREELGVSYEGEAIEIAFNPEFVLDVLRHIDTDKIMLSLKDAMSPGLFTPVSEENTDGSRYLNVVMPIRIETAVGAA